LSRRSTSWPTSGLEAEMAATSPVHTSPTNVESQTSQKPIRSARDRH
jgi:hypothetical protein